MRNIARQKPQSSNGRLQQYCDWYTDHLWVECYIWYTREEGPGRAAAVRPRLVPSSLYQMQQPTHQRRVYQLRIYYSMWHYNFPLHSKG